MKKYLKVLILHAPCNCSAIVNEVLLLIILLLYG